MFDAQMTLGVVSLLIAAFVAPLPATAEGRSSGDKQKLTSAEIRAVLEQGAASASLPEGMVIRVSACLGQLDQQAAGGGDAEHPLENWELTAHHARRIHNEADDDEGAVERREERPFDSSELCQVLLEGRALEIQERKGSGPKIALAGSRYRRGSRRIEVLLNRQTILELSETNGPVLDLYAETDARAFGALYDRLAGRARQAFEPKAE